MAMKTSNQARVAGSSVKNVQVQATPQKETTQMSEETTENTEETNGHTKESALKPIREAWLAAGAKMPSAEEGERLKKAYRAAKAAVDAADKAASDARAKLSEVAKVIMEKTGARTVTIDGVDHIPSVHGKSYFFRARGERAPAVSL